MSIRFEDNTDIIDNHIKNAVKVALKEMGIKAKAEIKSNCPVDTGALRRSYKYKCEGFTVTVGTSLDYAIYVEFKPENKGGRPHFRRSLESLEREFVSILKRALGGI